MSSKTNEVSLKAFDVKNLPLGTTQLGFNQKVDEGFTMVEDAIDQAIADLGNHKTVIDAIVDVADGAAAKAQQGVDNAATAQTQADKGVRDAATAQAKAEQVETDYKAADTAITEAYTQADTDLQSTIESAYKAADGEVTSAYKAADENVKKEATKYVNATKVINGVGGITSGTSFKEGTTVQQVLDMLLYPYVAPTISDVSAVTGGGTREKGVKVSISKVTATANKKARNIEKMDVLLGSEVKDTKNSSKNGETETFVFTLQPPIELTGTEDKTISVRVKDVEKAEYVSMPVANYKFIYPYYYGAVASANVTGISGLEKVVAFKPTSLKFDLNNQHPVLVVPGTVKKPKIVDQNGFDNTKAWTEKTITVKANDKTTQTYTVFVTSKPATASNFGYTFVY